MSESDGLKTILELSYETRQSICRYVDDVLGDFISNVRGGIKLYKVQLWDTRNDKVETARLEGKIHALDYCIDQLEGVGDRIRQVVPE
jgi:hypothetical protein